MEELVITLNGTGQAGKEEYKALLNTLFTRAQAARGGSLLSRLTKLYAQCVTLQRAIEEMLKEKESRIIELFLEDNNPIGKRCDIVSECFTVSDKPDYNYEGNDNDGLYRLKMQQIATAAQERKVLTQELSAIKSRIEFEHPNMHVEHNYNLAYNGPYAEVHKAVVSE